MKRKTKIKAEKSPAPYETRTGYYNYYGEIISKEYAYIEISNKGIGKILLHGFEDRESAMQELKKRFKKEKVQFDEACFYEMKACTYGPALPQFNVLPVSCDYEIAGPMSSEAIALEILKKTPITCLGLPQKTEGLLQSIKNLHEFIENYDAMRKNRFRGIGPTKSAEIKQAAEKFGIYSGEQNIDGRKAESIVRVLSTVKSTRELLGLKYFGLGSKWR